MPAESSSTGWESALSAASQLDALLASSDAAIIVKSLSGIVLRWSRAAERLYGYTSEEMVGRPVSLLFASDHRAEIEGILRKVQAGEEIHEVPTVRVQKGGSRIDILLTIAPIRDEAGRISGMLSFTRDESERRRAQQEIRTLSESAQSRDLLLESARRVALGILSSRTGLEALRQIAETARILSGARYAALGVAAPDGRSLSEFITVGLTPQAEASIGPRPRGAGLLGVLLHRGEPLLVDRISDHPASVGFPAGHPPMDSFLGVPIRRGDTVLGSLYLTDKVGGGSFTEADSEAVQALGAHAAVAIHNLELLARQRSLVSGLIDAQEEERRTVAYDLHDGLTQYVMAAHAHMESFRYIQGAGNSERAIREFDLGLKYLKDAVVESRRLVNGLRSLALDDLGLVGALEQMITEERRHHNWAEADLVHNIGGRRFDRTLETTVYRVAQEALTNVGKHSTASGAHLVLRLDDGMGEKAASLTLEVWDQGKGFDTCGEAPAPGHFGLHGMAERVNLAGGKFSVKSAPGEGATVIASFPVLEARHEARAGGMRTSDPVTDPSGESIIEGES